MRLQLGLLNEVDGPGVNGRSDALKYQCIPLFPDIPASYNKDLHEETVVLIHPKIESVFKLWKDYHKRF